MLSMKVTLHGTCPEKTTTENSPCTHSLGVSSACFQLVVSFLRLHGLTRVSSEAFNGVL